MKPYFFLFLLFSVFSSWAGTDNPQDDNKEVEKTIDTFFKILNTGDTTGLSIIIHPGANLTTVSSKEGKAMVSEITFEQFSKGIAKPRTQTWEEKISDLSIKTDGLLASVWTKYSFYINGKISHSGVDSFLLYKNGKQWQILQIADSRY